MGGGSTGGIEDLSFEEQQYARALVMQPTVMEEAGKPRFYDGLLRTLHIRRDPIESRQQRAAKMVRSSLPPMPVNFIEMMQENQINVGGGAEN